MTHHGNMSTVLNVTGYEQAQDSKGTLLTIHMKDPVYPTTVDLKYELIRMWT